MLAKRFEEYLNSQHIPYENIQHPRAYTAQEIAALTHIPGKNFAKTVILKVDGKMTMLVLPAQYKVDLNQIKRGTGAKYVELASENEFAGMFPECEVGAMPPFGNLYNMDVWVDKSLTQDEEIAFNACNHIELIKMAYSDFEHLVHPKVLEMSA